MSISRLFAVACAATVVAAACRETTGPSPQTPQAAPSDRLVGYFDVATTPDTTPEFAGAAYLISDSLGCWRALPWSEGPGRWLALAQPPPLTSGWQGNAFLVGQLVAGSPPSCGDARSINASTLAVYANLF